jgi:hypothetical protein
LLNCFLADIILDTRATTPNKTKMTLQTFRWLTVRIEIVSLCQAWEFVRTYLQSSQERSFVRKELLIRGLLDDLSVASSSNLEIMFSDSGTGLLKAILACTNSS